MCGITLLKEGSQVLIQANRRMRCMVLFFSFKAYSTRQCILFPFWTGNLLAGEEVSIKLPTFFSTTERCRSVRCLVNSLFFQHFPKPKLQILQPTMLTLIPLAAITFLNALNRSASPQARRFISFSSTDSLIHSSWKGLLHFFLNFGIFLAKGNVARMNERGPKYPSTPYSRFSRQIVLQEPIILEKTRTMQDHFS